MALTETTEIAPTKVATACSSGPSSADLNNEKSFQAALLVLVCPAAAMQHPGKSDEKTFRFASIALNRIL
jgi:hypothetical protein